MFSVVDKMGVFASRLNNVFVSWSRERGSKHIDKFCLSLMVEFWYEILQSFQRFVTEIEAWIGEARWGKTLEKMRAAAEVQRISVSMLECLWKFESDPIKSFVNISEKNVFEWESNVCEVWSQFQSIFFKENRDTSSLEEKNNSFLMKRNKSVVWVWRKRF